MKQHICVKFCYITVKTAKDRKQEYQMKSKLSPKAQEKKACHSNLNVKTMLQFFDCWGMTHYQFFPTDQSVIKFYPSNLASLWSNAREMTATLVRTLPVSAPQQHSCTHSPLCMGISYKKQNSSCSTANLQPCCLSSKIRVPKTRR